MDFFDKLIVIFSSGNPDQILTQLVVKANEKELKRASELGWVMPLSLPFPTYKRFISDFSNSKEDFEKYFTGFYTEDFESRVKIPLLKYIHHVDSSIQKLILEAITCYEQRLFQICIPALFSVIEGALVELSNKGDRKIIRYRDGLKRSRSQST